MSAPNDPREEPLNDVARRIMVASNYDPHFSGIEERLIMETKLFLARYDAVQGQRYQQHIEDSRIIRQLEHGRVDLSEPIKHYGAMLDELEGRKTVYRVGEGVEQVQFTSINMIIFCPQCGLQHIDAPEDHKQDCQKSDFAHLDKGCTCDRWTNPSHKSHLCGYCNHVWRPADVPTNGVLEIRTRGQIDSTPAMRQVRPLDRFLPKWLHKKRGTTLP